MSSPFRFVVEMNPYLYFELWDIILAQLTLKERMRSMYDVVWDSLQTFKIAQLFGLLGPKLPTLFGNCTPDTPRLIDLSLCRIKSLSFLARFHNLRTLNLHTCQGILPSELVHLSGLVNLQTLDLSNTGKLIDDENFGVVCSLPELTYLSIGSNQLSEVGLNEITKLKKLSSLKILFCQKVTKIDPILTMTSLRFLEVSGLTAHIESTTLDPLLSLEQVAFSYWNYSSNDIKILEEITKLKTLKKLELSASKWDLFPSLNPTLEQLKRADQTITIKN